MLATVWLLGGTQHDVRFDDVARRLRGVHHFRDVRVKPHLLKHCSRSHMLEPGSERETVRVTKKGMRPDATVSMLIPSRLDVSMVARRLATGLFSSWDASAVNRR